MRVLTHAGGTGYSTVRHVLTHLGAVVYPVHSVTEAHTTPADAVILLGGSDINPRYYGQEPRHAQVGVVQFRARELCVRQIGAIHPRAF